MARRGQNEGSIHRREDGRWCAVVNLGYENGRRKRKYFYGQTRPEVARQLAKAMRDLQQGLPVAVERQTLQAFLDDWLRDVARPRVKPRTFVRYEGLIRLHITPVLGRRLLANLTPKDVQALYARKVAEGLSPRTVGHIHRLLHVALEQALRWNLLQRNVCDLVDPPRVTRPEMRVLDAEQARALLAAAAGEPLEALYVLALSTGMRQGELLSLKWQDIDLTKGTLQVRRSLGRVRGQGFVVDEPKSSQSRRRITLTPQAIAALRQHRARQAEERLLAGAEWTEANFVFCNAVGLPLEAGNVLRRSFWPLLERAELPRIRFHDLRHSAATLLLSLGTHPKVVQELLGHSQYTLTLDTYSHVMPNLQPEAIGRLAELLERDVEPR